MRISESNGRRGKNDNDLFFYLKLVFFFALRGEGRGLLGRFWWGGQTKGGGGLFYCSLRDIPLLFLLFFKLGGDWLVLLDPFSHCVPRGKGWGERK